MELLFYSANVKNNNQQHGLFCQIHWMNLTVYITVYYSEDCMYMMQDEVCVGFFSWITFQKILQITPHRGQHCSCRGRYSLHSRPHGSSSQPVASWKGKQSKPPWAISLLPPATVKVEEAKQKYQFNQLFAKREVTIIFINIFSIISYWPLIVISTF